MGTEETLELRNIAMSKVADLMGHRLYWQKLN